MFPELGDLVIKAAMDAFSRPVTFQPVMSVPGSGDVVVRGVFDAAHEFVTFTAEGVPVSSADPVLGVRLSEFGVSPLQGDRFVIDTRNYEVFDVQPDGQAGAKLRLKEIE